MGAGFWLHLTGDQPCLSETQRYKENSFLKFWSPFWTDLMIRLKLDSRGRRMSFGTSSAPSRLRLPSTPLPFLSGLPAAHMTWPHPDKSLTVSHLDCLRLHNWGTQVLFFSSHPPPPVYSGDKLAPRQLPIVQAGAAFFPRGHSMWSHHCLLHWGRKSGNFEQVPQFYLVCKR